MITNLRLKNFKTFESIDIPLRPLTLLSGVNGSGKSSVLQALAVVRQSAMAGCLRSGEGLLLNGELVDLGTGRDVLFEHANDQEIGISITDDSGTLAWIFQYAEKDDLLQLITSSSTAEETSESTFLGNSLQFIRADRVSPAVVFPKSYADVVRRRFLGARGQYTVHYLAAMQDQTVSERRRKAGPAIGSGLLDQVSAWLAEITPGVKIGSKEVSGADLAQLWFTFHGRAGIQGSNEYRPTNVGFGLTYCLPIITACLSAAPGDMLMLENPEAHLHPRGQSIMGELLALTAADGVQVLFETHSEHVMNGVRFAVKNGAIQAPDVNFHYFQASSTLKGSEIFTPTLYSNGRLSQWPTGFFDEWERVLSEFI